MEIFILAYNNLFCVEYQIKTLKQFCQDSYNLIVVDSNCGQHPENTRLKKELCDKYGIEMLELPVFLENPSCLNHSVVLGKKLNYVFYQIIKKRQPKYFGFLDQDFFAFKDFSLIRQLEEYGMYGDVAEPDGHKTPMDKTDNLVNGPWMIHPWLSFYKYDLVESANMDWVPCTGFDTGGMNWYNFISKGSFDKNHYWLRDKTIMYYPFYNTSNDGPDNFRKHYFRWENNIVSGQVQIYDKTFIHMLNSKFLDNPLNPKTCWCKGFLDLALLIGGARFCNDQGFYNDGPSNNII